MDHFYTLGSGAGNQVTFLYSMTCGTYVPYVDEKLSSVFIKAFCSKLPGLWN